MKKLRINKIANYNLDAKNNRQSKTINREHFLIFTSWKTTKKTTQENNVKIKQKTY